MGRAGKRERSGGWVIVVAAMVSLGGVGRAGAAERPLLTLPRPSLTTRHFGIPAAWPHWHLDTPSTKKSPAVASAPSPELPVRRLVKPATPKASSGTAAAPPPKPAVATAAPPRPAAVSERPAPAAGPALQPQRVEQEFLRRAVQRSLDGDPTRLPEDRGELAVRALEALQPATAASAGDPLRQIGLERWRLGNALAPGAAGMAFDTVRSQEGQIRHEQLHLGGDNNGPAFHLDLLNIDRGFTRFQDLTAEEQSWAGAMRGMRRLDLGAEKLSLAGGLSDFGVLQLTDGKARARRMSLGFSGGRWSVQALSQQVDDSFQRLGDLTAADKKLFGAEKGIARNSLQLGYAFSPKQKLSASTLSLRAASGGAERQQFEYQDGPRLQLHLDFGHVDPKFDRINELIDVDKKALAPLLGTRWSDLTATMSPTRWLTMENHWREATRLDTGVRSTELRNAWTFQLAPKSKLVLTRDMLTGPAGASGQGWSLTQSVRLEQWLTHSVFFTGLRETVQNSLTSGPEISGRRTEFHLNTAPKLKVQGSADFTTAVSSDGRNERALKWSLGLPLRRGLALQVKGEQHDLPGQPGIRAFTVGLTGQIAREWNLMLSLNSSRTPHGASTRDLGARLTFAGLPDTPLFRETHLVLGLGDTLGLASAVPAPQNAPKPSSPPDGPPPVPVRRLQSVSIESKFRGQPVAVGYAAAAGTAGGLTYQWSTNPKRSWQFEILREMRDLGHTSLVARRRYALLAKLGRATQLSCSFETQPEESPGKLLVGHRQTKVEARTRLGGLDTTASVAWDRDDLRSLTSTLTGFSLTGNIDPEDTLRFSYTGRTEGTNPSLPAQEVQLAYERKPEECLKVAFSAQWQDWARPRRDDLAWQLDLTALF